MLWDIWDIISERIPDLIESPPQQADRNHIDAFIPGITHTGSRNYISAF